MSNFTNVINVILDKSLNVISFLKWNHQKIFKYLFSYYFIRLLFYWESVRIEIMRNISFIIFLILLYNIQKRLSVCLSVWTSIDSAPGPDTDMRPVSLEPAWSEGGPLGSNFPEKWPVAKLPK